MLLISPLLCRERSNAPNLDHCIKTFCIYINTLCMSYSSADTEARLLRALIISIPISIAYT